ncbi:2OG-Fe(II) oxygenase [Micromonospora sp. LOL_021]|uniref:2OG-Fe(II) oxygenase n=1 Tax=Micromonospora sp. LOL_021 TaxID=3345417 RepID=UPI003A856742
MPASPVTPPDRLAALLGTVGPAGAFSARRTASPHGLRLAVRGVGPIALPAAAEQAKQLCSVGRPARFGKGEQTLTDAGVRDTWEVPTSLVDIDEQRWHETLHPMLDQLRADLGLPQGCELVAELHSMLVYAPGQFFAPHQDSEKVDAMIGTLVVTLPSESAGGVLSIEHAGRTGSYESSPDELTFVAFYADCRHQVSPVTAGHRIVLTYNLLLAGDPVTLAAGSLGQDLVTGLAGCLDDHFAEPTDGPARLVYLLDHEYTQRALGWDRLKGDDVGRAAAVRAAAQAAGCEVTLALAELQETWSALDPEESWGRWGRGRSRYGRYRNDEEPSGGSGSGEYELEELIDSSMTLDCWLDESGEVVPTSLRISDDEVCATTPTADLSPQSSEYEGYMGNYGNTLDRWYRRAAIVVWPRRWTFAIRAQASPGWALDRLADLLRAGDVAGARRSAATLASFWRVTPAAGELVVGRALAVAWELDEPDLAAMLLALLRVEALAPADAPVLARLATRYGESWTRDRVNGWFGRNWLSRSSLFDKQTPDWLASLPAMCAALRATPDTGGVLVGRLLVAGVWSELHGRARGMLTYPAARDRRRYLADLGPQIAVVLAGAASLGTADLADPAVEFLCQDEDDVLACAMSTLRAARATAPDQAGQQVAGIDTLAAHVARRLERQLARPARAADDWSVELPKGCDCELCATLVAFLGDPARRTFEWPLAEQRRRHVHSRVDQADLPVDHQTRRSGRPYTLVLRKTDALFDRERESRRRAQEDLAWLTLGPEDLG